MSYQNVSTPRFYVDIFTYLQAIGQYTGIGEHDNYDVDVVGDSQFGLNPTPQVTITSQSGQDSSWNVPYTFGVPLTPFLSSSDNTNFAAILGHNMASWVNGDNNQGLALSIHNSSVNPITGYEEIANAKNDGTSGWGEQLAPDLDGFSIYRFINHGTELYDNNGDYLFNFYAKNADYSSPSNNEMGLNPVKIGSIAMGRYYDMPVAPDLSLSLEHDYSGIKKTTSMSGASFSNASWIKPPKWGDKEAWQLGDFPRLYSGRRIWDLSFSYISDSDLEPRNYTGITELIEPNDATWFENVLRYTMGGHLPFIFQPDKDATYTWTDEDPPHITEIPEFAICRFDMNSFKREQVAPGVYNIKIKVKESW